MIVEDKEWIELITPCKGGCKYHLVIEGNDYRYTLGCLGHYYNLCSTLEREVFSRWQCNKEQPVLMDISEELKSQLLAIEPCSKCGGTILKI